MKIGVTGATGFIGRHVIAELAKHPVEIIAYTRQSSWTPPLDSPIKIISMDIGQTIDNLYESMQRPDILIHLAWGGLPNYKSLHHFEQELPKHYGFLNSLLKSGLTNIVVAGTCLEYGMQSGPLSENMAPQPSNPYGLAKDTLRRKLTFLKAEHPFKLTWARLFYLYGEGQSESSLFSLLKKAVAHGEPVFNMSAGEQLRDYLAVTEAARYLVKFAMNDCDNGVVNICSGIPISVRTLVEGWIKEYQWNIVPNLGYYDYPDYEPLAFWGTRQKLENIITNRRFIQ